MEELTYRVYEAEITDTGAKGRFTCSNVAEVALRQRITKGELLIDPRTMTLLLETPNRNEALRMAAHEF